LDDYRAVIVRRFGSGAQAFGATRRPRVTLITVVLNASRTLEQTITSIQSQTFADLEHVVVDGGSDDGTVDLLRARLRPQDFWISEPDLGISDGFNKGVALAAGDLIQFVNGDDWLSPDQVEVAVRGLDATGADFVFGDVIFYRGGQPDFRYVGEPDYAKAIRRRMPTLNHATALVRRDAFEHDRDLTPEPAAPGHRPQVQQHQVKNQAHADGGAQRQSKPEQRPASRILCGRLGDEGDGDQYRRRHQNRSPRRCQMGQRLADAVRVVGALHLQHVDEQHATKQGDETVLRPGDELDGSVEQECEPAGRDRSAAVHDPEDVDRDLGRKSIALGLQPARDPAPGRPLFCNI
jgi:hypothetical protein